MISNCIFVDGLGLELRILNKSDPPKDDGEPDACKKLESEKRPKIG